MKGTERELLQQRAIMKGPRSLLLSLIPLVFEHCKDSATKQIGTLLVKEKWILSVQKVEKSPTSERKKKKRI